MPSKGLRQDHRSCRRCESTIPASRHGWVCSCIPCECGGWRKRGSRRCQACYSSSFLQQLVCSSCNTLLGEGDFPGHRKSGKCKECKNIQRSERKHQLEPGTYKVMLAAQGGACKLCKLKPSGRRLAFDHDHSCCPGLTGCGKCVRGLLCTKCNSLLGLADDCPERLLAAIDYLSDYG